MSDVTLHPTPRWRDVVLEQVHIVGMSLRPVALVVTVVLAVGTLMIVSELVRGGPGFDSNDMFPIPLICFLFPFAVWRSEKRFGPDFLWTLPVDRRRLALARVFAGWVWLMAAVAVFVSWLLVLALFAGSEPGVQAARIPFIPAIAAYLFGSALVLGLRHPLRWLFGTAGVIFLMGMLSDLFHQPDDGEWRNVPGATGFFSAVQDAAAVWRTLPELAQWAISTFLWLGAGLAALWIAVSRHRETRRR